MGLVYLALPLGLAPLAAIGISRDRERGMASVLSTTPLTPIELLTGRLLAIAVILVASISTTLPWFWVTTQSMALHAASSLAPYLLWALIIGGTSAVVGLLAGYAWLDRSAAALSTAFGVLLGWIALASQAEALLRLAGEGAAKSVVTALVHLSPLAWAADALQDNGFGFMDFGPGLAVGALALGFAATLALVAISGWLQNVAGWQSRGSIQRSAGIGVIGVLLAVPLLSGALAEAPEEPDLVFPDGRATTTMHLIKFNLGRPGPGGLEGGLDRPAELSVTVLGHPNATVALAGLRVQSPFMQVELLEPAPAEITLDNVGPASGRPFATAGDDIGVAVFTVPAQVTALEPRTYHLFTFQASLDGHDVEAQRARFIFSWDTSAGLGALSAAVPSVLFSAVGVLVPRRLNRW